MRAAVSVAKIGGKILYTTCSIFAEEGEDIIKSILEEFGNSIKSYHLMALLMRDSFQGL